MFCVQSYTKELGHITYWLEIAFLFSVYDFLYIILNCNILCSAIYTIHTQYIGLHKADNLTFNIIVKSLIVFNKAETYLIFISSVAFINKYGLFCD